MYWTSLRRMLLVIAVGGLAVLLAGVPSPGQVGDGPGGVGGKAAKGKGGFGGDGGFGGGGGGFAGGGGFGGGFGGKGKAKKARGGMGGIGAAPAVALPEGLNHVPSDALGFVHIRIADSLKGAPSQALLKQMRPDGEQGKFVAQVEKRLGVRLADLETITVFLLGPLERSTPLSSSVARSALPTVGGADAREALTCLAALTYTKPVDRKAVLRALVETNDVLWPKLSGVFLSDRCILFGTSAGLLDYTTRFYEYGFARNTAFNDFLNAGAEPHLIVAGAQVPAAARARLKQAMRDTALGPYGALLPLLYLSAGVTVDVRDAADVTVRFAWSDGFTLEAVRSLRTLAELSLDAKDANLPIALSADMHKALRKAVAEATIAQVQQPPSVEMRLRLEASPDELARLLAQAVVRLR